MSHVTTDQVRDAARGQWASILAALAPGLGPALQRPGRHGPCPVHGGKDGFRVFRDVDETGGGICNSCEECADGFALLMWINGWSFIEAKQAVVDYLGLEPGTDRLPPPRRRPPPVVQEQSEEDTQKRKDKLTAVWKAAKPDPAMTTSYLNSRGLFVAQNPLAPDALRVHPDLPYHEDGQLIGTYPAMVARVQALDGTGVSVHRTYLAPDGSGKASVPAPKKLMTPIRPGAIMGAAIRLTEAEETLNLAEGIETALAVMEAYELESERAAMWATVTAGGMETVQIPEMVRRVVIWPDNDANGRGQEAAAVLAQRLHDEGKEVYVLLPPIAGDWLDVLNQQGHTAIWKARMQGKRWTPPQPTATTQKDAGRSESGRKGRKPPLTGRQLADLPPPSFLLEDYLPRGGLAVLYGPSGAGKSFLALDWALSIASGRPWFKKAVVPSSVMYVAGEGHAGLEKRLQAWGRERSLPGNVLDLPVEYDPAPVQLMDPADVDEFIAYAQPLRPALVVLDTLARCSAGADENSARDMSRVIQGADKIRTSLQATVLLVHHMGKSGTTERGSSVIRGAADAMIALTLQDDVIQLVVDKAKDSEPPDQIDLRRIPVLHSDSCVIGLAEFASDDHKPSPAQLRALKDLRELGGFASMAKWMEMAETKLRQFQPVVNALTAKGYVEAPEPGTRGGKYTMTTEGYRAL